MGEIPILGEYESLNLSPVCLKVSGGSAERLGHTGHGISRCNLRLERGRGTGFVCKILRGPFRGCCSGTSEVPKRANTGLVVLLRDELSGMMFHVKFTEAEGRTHRVISRGRMLMGKGYMGVPSCLMGTNSRVRVERGSGNSRECGNVLRMANKHLIPR